MADGILVREPAVSYRGRRGLRRRWSVAWVVFNPATLDMHTRRRLFFTERGAERWFDRWESRIRPAERSIQHWKQYGNCIACSGVPVAFVVDGAFRKHVCGDHKRLYFEQGYEVGDLDDLDARLRSGLESSDG